MLERVPEFIVPTLVGRTRDDDWKVYTHGFDWQCPCGNVRKIIFMAGESASAAHIEDALAKGVESAVISENIVHQQQVGKLSVSPDDKPLRLDLAEELRHIRFWMKKSRESSTGRTLFKGATIAAPRFPNTE